MNILNIIKSQLIEVIEWTDDSRDTLSYRWSDEDKEIKNGAQLIVRESQQVQFVAAGQYADTDAQLAANYEKLQFGPADVAGGAGGHWRSDPAGTDLPASRPAEFLLDPVA